MALENERDLTENHVLLGHPLVVADQLQKGREREEFWVSEWEGVG